MTELEKAALAKLRWGLMPTPAEAAILRALAEEFGDYAAFGKHVQDMNSSDFADWLGEDETKTRTFKDRVRERMEKTGENYCTARTKLMREEGLS